MNVNSAIDLYGVGRFIDGQAVLGAALLAGSVSKRYM